MGSTRLFSGESPRSRLLFGRDDDEGGEVEEDDDDNIMDSFVDDDHF